MPMWRHDPTDSGLANRSPTMMPNLLWILPALALLTCGWLAGAWYYKRKIRALKGQINAVRQTAAEHANQARRQVGQLQAELAARPPLHSAERAGRAGTAASAAAAVEARRAVVDKVVPDHNSAAPSIHRNGGFADTQVMERPNRP
jgi:hypothetical protein